jgi:hypothetical protein
VIEVGDFAPAERPIKLGGDTYLCRLPLERIAELQASRGYAVQWPDGSRGKRPKPMGAIWREHIQNAEYDPEDSRAIIFQSLLGGATVTRKDGTQAKVDRAVAEEACRLWIDPIPHEEKWQVAMEILIACCQGYRPPTEGDSGNAQAASSENGPSITPPPLGTVRFGESRPETAPT